MLNQNIILTGFMGTGKSTVGRLIANELNYKFVDTDELIMARCNMTVAEIFCTKGEQGFRQMEKELALELSQQDRLVISTGGGMLLNSANVETLEGRVGDKKKGRIFCLVATIDEIIARVGSDSSIERPLLKVANPKEEIKTLLNARKDKYSQFTQIDTTGLTSEDVCRVIMEHLMQQNAIKK
ncbi:MAG: shikimate kinase [Desulfamplus sp.]|nr:shikimate kinase [Desulfamplus sp.]